MEIKEDLFDNVKPGSRVHYLTPQGQTRSGTVVMNRGTHLVLNRGGGQPQVVTPKNYVKHSEGGKVKGALLSNLAKSMKKEETEQIDEISDKTKLNYVVKAKKNIASLASKKGAVTKTLLNYRNRFPSEDDAVYDKAEKDTDKLDKKITNRKKGIARATTEEAEQIDEISKETKDSYIAKRGSQLSSFLYAKKQNMTGRQQKNAVYGLKRATGKPVGIHAIAKFAKEEAEQINELSPATKASYKEKALNTLTKRVDAVTNPNNPKSRRKLAIAAGDKFFKNRNARSIAKDNERERIASGLRRATTEEVVNEGSYDKAMSNYARSHASDYLNGGNKIAYGVGEFDHKAFGVSKKQAESDYKTAFKYHINKYTKKVHEASLPRTGTDEIADMEPKVNAVYDMDPQLKAKLTKKLLRKRKQIVKEGLKSFKEMKEELIDEVSKKVKGVNWQKIKTSHFSVYKSTEGGMPLKYHMAQLAAHGIPSRKAHSPYVGHTALEVPKKHEKKTGRILYGEAFSAGDKVRLKKDWAHDDPDKVYKIWHTNGDGQHWIGDKNKRGWYAGDHQLRPARTWKKTYTMEEFIAELSGETLSRYVTKALADRKTQAGMADMAHRIHTPERAKYFADKAAARIAKRSRGVKTAVGKIASSLPAEPLAAHTAGEKSKHGGWSGMEARESEYRANQQLAGTTPRRTPGHYLTRDGRTLSGPHKPDEAVRAYKDMSDSRNVKIVHVKEAVDNKMDNDKAGKVVQRAIALAKSRKKKSNVNVEPELETPSSQMSQPLLQGAEGPTNVRV